MTPHRGPVLREHARAKLNLYLHVVGRRDDGLHLLDSLVVFAAVADVVYAAPADDLSLSLTGPFASALQGDADNLALRAARALAEEVDPSGQAHLTLDKRLPVASGIGGGSADAAATLRVLGRLWNRAADPAALARIALALGADVPVCLASRPHRLGGVGERLEPAPELPGCGVVLVNPGVAVATASVFRARAGTFSNEAGLPARWDDAAAMAADLRELRNDLEPPARNLCPAIDAVLSALAAQPGCLLARMSGSGATCFGLFATPEIAAETAPRLMRDGWWVWGGSLRTGDQGAS
jgi:4-diphosphocytidyl-2-C-methyl-D-erythritol kinase